MTYGKFINFINQDAIYLCSLIRIIAKIKHELKTSKNELGSFCSQYGYKAILPHFVRRKRQYKKAKRKLHKHKNLKEKSKHERYKGKENYFKKRFNREIKCFKCGQKGHIAPNYPFKKKIQNLEIDEDLKIQIIDLIPTDSESSYQNTKIIRQKSKKSRKDSSNSNDFLLIEDNSSSYDSSSLQSSCDCVKNCLCNIKSINMLTNEENLLI